jgi:hypothetical protein
VLSWETQVVVGRQKQNCLLSSRAIQALRDQAWLTGGAGRDKQLGGTVQHRLYGDP